MSGSVPPGVLLVGFGDGREYGCERGNGPPVDALDPVDLVHGFGVEDQSRAALSWSWCGPGGAPIDDEAVGGAALVHAAWGARMPLSEAPRFIGAELGREGLAALGFIASEYIAPPLPSPIVGPSEMLQVKDAAGLMGLSVDALRKQIQRGAVDHRFGLVRRRGARMQFHRATLIKKLGAA